MTNALMPRPDRPHPGLEANLPRLRAMLEEQRRFRLDQLAELPTAGKHSDLAPAQRAAADSARAEVEAALADAARQALHDIETALDRMQDGRYGICVRCGGQIPLERLDVIPQTGLCVTCQRHQQGKNRG